MKKFLFFIFTIFTFIFNLNFVFADNYNNYGLGNNNLNAGGLFGNADIPTVISRVIQVVMGLSATIMLLVIVYAGISYLLSRGDSGKTKKAIELIKTSIIGIVIIVSAYAISQFVINNIKFIAS